MPTLSFFDLLGVRGNASPRDAAVACWPLGWIQTSTGTSGRPALARRQRDPGFRVIPVLLPGADLNALLDLKSFFDSKHWIDFRNDLQDRTAIGGLAGEVVSSERSSARTGRQCASASPGNEVALW